jgi:hypothetical protein
VVGNVDYSQVQRYEDFLSQLQLEHAKDCGNLLKTLDSKISHLPRVTSIASGVGHCIYEAKLKELLGIKGVVSSSFPGKGETIHKLLALASLEVFGGNNLPTDLEKFFENLSEQLEETKATKEDIEVAKELFTSILYVKNDLFRIVGINVDNVRPVVEQQFYDYDLHMLGVPDLVLEDIENKRAVVVEWKSYPLQQEKAMSVSSYEKAQVTAYAMLEARRLGYELNPSRPDQPSIFDAISGKLTDSGIEDVRVLPVIIRPDQKTNKRLSIPPHPLLSGRGNLKNKYNEFRKVMGEIYVTARYLTYIMTNFWLYGYGKEDFDECSKQIGNRKRIVFVWPPPRPIPRGKPTEQNNSKLCKFCSVRDECKFYIGEHHMNTFHKIMWKLRYSSLSEKEKLMWPFRAIYELSRFHTSRDNIVSKIKKGSSVEWDGEYVQFSNRPPRNRFRVKLSERDRISFKIDVIDRLYYDENLDSFIGIRQAREFEINSKMKKVYHPFVLDESTPVVIYLNDKASMIPLSINMTGAISEVNFEEDKDGKTVIKYTIGIPSFALSFQKTVLRKYFQLYSKTEMFEDVILVQVGVDLTHIDLITLDAFQRVIGRRIEKLENELKKNKELEEEKRKELEREIKRYQELKKRLENQEQSLDFESEFEEDIISKGVLSYLYPGEGDSDVSD